MVRCILVPHAGYKYTKYCMKHIINKSKNSFSKAKKIIYISTLHETNSNNIIISDNKFVCNNNFKNDIESYKYFSNLKVDNDIEKREHSLIWNETFLKLLLDENDNINFSVFYINNNLKKNIFLRFAQEINNNHKNQYYILNSDFSHIGNRFNDKFDYNKFNTVEEELDYREKKYVNDLLYKKNIDYENISNFPGCGALVAMLGTHLNFLDEGELICKTHSEIKKNNLNNKYSTSIKSIKKNKSSVVSYIGLSYNDNKIFGGDDDIYNKIMKTKFFSREDNNINFNWNDVDVEGSIVFLTIYDKRKIKLIGCMGTKEGHNLKEKVKNSIKSIVNNDDRFDINTKIDDMTFEITNIELLNGKKYYEKKDEWINDLVVLKKKEKTNKSMYVSLHDNNDNFISDAYYIPSVLYAFNDMNKLYSSLIKKASRRNLNSNTKIKLYLINSDNYVDAYYVDTEKKEKTSRLFYGGITFSYKLILLIILLIYIVILFIIIDKINEEYVSIKKMNFNILI